MKDYNSAQSFGIKTNLAINVNDKELGVITNAGRTLETARFQEADYKPAEFNSNSDNSNISLGEN